MYIKPKLWDNIAQFNINKNCKRIRNLIFLKRIKWFNLLLVFDQFNSVARWVWALNSKCQIEKTQRQIIIVYVWSQYDGPNIEQWTIGYGWRQNQEAKLKIVGGVIPWSYAKYISRLALMPCGIKRH